MEKSNYRYYENEQLEISSIDSRLNDDERKIRRFLMNFLIDNHKPFYIKKLDKLAISLNMNVELVESIIGHLIENNTIVTDEYDNINFIYPVSALETNHNVELADGRTFHAMCAIDAIGAAFTFKQDVTISSKCSNTGEDVNVVIENGQLTSYKPTDLHILHVDLNKNLNWSGNC